MLIEVLLQCKVRKACTPKKDANHKRIVSFWLIYSANKTPNSGGDAMLNLLPACIRCARRAVGGEGRKGGIELQEGGGSAAVHADAA